MATSYAHLELILAAYMENPGLHADRRAAARALHLEPLDGASGRRLADMIEDMAREAAHGG